MKWCKPNKLFMPLKNYHWATYHSILEKLRTKLSFPRIWLMRGTSVCSRDVISSHWLHDLAQRTFSWLENILITIEDSCLLNYDLQWIPSLRTPLRKTINNCQSKSGFWKASHISTVSVSEWEKMYILHCALDSNYSSISVDPTPFPK